MLPKRNIYFKGDFFFFACCSVISKQASRIILTPLFGYLDFNCHFWTTYTTFTVVLRFSCPFISWQTCQKPPGLCQLCQKHLQKSQYISGLNWVLSTIAKWQETLLGTKGYGERWVLPLRSCWLTTCLHWCSSEEFCLCCLSALVFLDAFYGAS